MAESIQHKLDRVRPPMVQITYDVEIGDAIVMKEIPFVVGVMADLSGKPEKALPKMKDRKFVEIDRDNFDKVLEGMKPRMAFRVDNKLKDDNTQMNVELKFRSIDDFHPENVAKQIEPISKLLEARKNLSDLRSKLDGNDRLDELLQGVIHDTESMQKLQTEVGSGTEKKQADTGEEEKE